MDDDGQIMQFRGQTDEFLQHGSGRASLNLLEMAREGLSSEMRSAVDAGARQRQAGTRVSRCAIARRTSSREVAIQAIPFKGAPGERYYVILFEKAKAAKRKKAAPEVAATMSTPRSAT